MPFLIFLGALVAGTGAILATVRFIDRRRRGPIVPIVRIGTYDQEQLADLARRTLTAAGIKSEPRGGPFFPGHRTPISVAGQWELWVREADANQARAILGID